MTAGLPSAIRGVSPGTAGGIPARMAAGLNRPGELACPSIVANLVKAQASTDPLLRFSDILHNRAL